MGSVGPTGRGARRPPPLRVGAIKPPLESPPRHGGIKTPSARMRTGVAKGGRRLTGARTPGIGVNAGLPAVNPRLPDVNARLPNVNPRLQAVNPRLPDINARLPNVNPRLPGVSHRLPDANPRGIDVNTPPTDVNMPSRVVGSALQIARRNRANRSRRVTGSNSTLGPSPRPSPPSTGEREPDPPLPLSRERPQPLSSSARPPTALVSGSRRWRKSVSRSAPTVMRPSTTANSKMPVSCVPCFFFTAATHRWMAASAS
jgi:hypothetical protein